MKHDHLMYDIINRRGWVLVDVGDQIMDWWAAHSTIEQASGH